MTYVPKKIAFKESRGGFDLTIYAGDGGWRIGAGASTFLVAEGSAWSRNFGKELFDRLASGEIDFKAWRADREGAV